MKHKKYYCPCCGFKGLDKRAYEKLDDPPFNIESSPPYSLTYGGPSYEVCPCCGYEFGNDDEPGTGGPTDFKTFLKEWVDEGCNWFEESSKPDEWSLDLQLEKAGIK